MNILISILLFVAMFLALGVAIYLCDRFIFKKVRINKFIPLAIAVVGLICGFILNKVSVIPSVIVTFISAIFLSWFLKLQQSGGVKVQKNIKIKPKAKPNRVKKDPKKVLKK